jgi:hypothetical protein
MMRWRQLSLLLLLLAGLFAFTLPLAAQVTPAQQLVLDARADLEALADAVFGAGNRPEGWTGNADSDSPSLVTDLWYDNELTADRVFGAGIRPDAWIGATTNAANVLARHVRHDLELMADFQLGSRTRPNIWRGASPLLSCDRTLQNTLTLLDTFYSLETTITDAAFNFCQAIQADIEDELNNIYFGTQLDDQPPLDPLDLVLAVRGDLERLADEELGLNNRPPGWVGNRDRSSTTLIGDTFVDLGLLADELLGVNVRPDGWIGAISILPATSYFNLRYDLELLTDNTFGTQGRPTGWQGLLPLARCAPLTQQLIFIAQVNYDFSIEGIDAAAPDFCRQASNAVNQLAENPPVPDVAAEEDNPRVTTSDIAFVYLDVGATQYMGMMPAGTEFRALYRNFGESTMMFVAGEDFAVYIDVRWTNLPETTFRALPTLEGVSPISFCNASWCSGPGPTPTPTGGGPLVALIFAATPIGTPDTVAIGTTKTQYSWTNVRVTYVADNAATGTAQVTLEVCAQPAATATDCEPVTRVFDNATNTERPVLGQNNGLNVYEIRYGYSTNLLIESVSRFSTDVWISDPTLR